MHSGCDAVSQGPRRRLLRARAFTGSGSEVTGWSQVHGREDMSWPDRFRYDAWYLEHWSLWLDVRILARTAAQLFRPEPVPVVDTMNIERRARRTGPEGRGSA